MIKFRLLNEEYKLDKKVAKHVACIFDPNRNTPLSIGMNHIPNNSKNSCHAEVDAFCRLNMSRRVRSVNIIVLRIDNNASNEQYKLLSSKPCTCCTVKLNQLSKKGYNLKKVYYSTDNDDIVHEKFDTLLQSEPRLSKFDEYRLACEHSGVILVSVQILPKSVYHHLNKFRLQTLQTSQTV